MENIQHKQIKNVLFLITPTQKLKPRSGFYLNQYSLASLGIRNQPHLNGKGQNTTDSFIKIFVLDSTT